MPIIRKKIDTNYTKLWNGTVQNENLSLRAKGLLWYMLSLPDDWDFTIKGIAEKLKESEKIIIKTLHELEEFGYHKKEHIYENGRIKDWVYYIYVEPEQDIIDNYKSKHTKNKKIKQDVQKQHSCKQHCYFSSDKQTITNKLVIENKQTNKIKEQNIYSQNEEEIKKKNKIFNENVKCIIDYLNETANTKYRYNTPKTVQLIGNRFKDGFVLDDFYDVIDNKWKDWKGTEWEKYMRPETLFGNKFENYLNQKNNFKGTPKTSYSSKPTFDNTASHKIATNNLTKEEYDKLSFEEKVNYIKKLPIASMTEEQKEFFNQNCLARDENGNLLSF